MRTILTGLLVISTLATIAQQDAYIPVEAMVPNSQRKTYGVWKSYPTRVVAGLKGYTPQTIKTGRYGGRLDRRYKATGFFRAQQINERWWIIDPDGHPMVNIGLNNVAAGSTDTATALLEKKYGNRREWARQTKSLLDTLGFNSFGAWTDYKAFENINAASSQPFSYTIIKGFMSDYGKKRGSTYQASGHTGYPDNTIFVFDPAFEQFCDEYAQSLAVYKDDPRLFGYFSDNEMPFQRLTLDRYLQKKDTADPGCRAAKKWLKENSIDTDDITDQVRHRFLGFMADRYYSIVSKAIKKYDPNHLYLGSRLHSYEKKVPEFMQAVGKYVDVIAINYYREWTPVKDEMANWLAWGARPYIITEWYTKGEDSGMPNYSGAGWIVRSQEDRGRFFQHFALGLLEAKGCVGYHWFKYQDNDPTNMKTDPSNRDANKGIVDLGFAPYAPLTGKMKELNTHVYSIIDFLDNRK